MRFQIKHTKTMKTGNRMQTQEEEAGDQPVMYKITKICIIVLIDTTHYKVTPITRRLCPLVIDRTNSSILSII
jgi:hypothetical protein